MNGKNQSQAAVAAGYSPKNPDVSGAVAMAQLRRKVPDILIRLGLYPEKVFSDVLVPGLRAKRAEHFSHGGVVIETREFVDHEQRGKYFDRWCKLIGLYGSADEDHDRFVTRPTVNLVITDPAVARAVAERLARSGGDSGLVRMDDTLDEDAGRSGPGSAIQADAAPFLSESDA